jgi:2-polyprenyl-3-methyl-5-hydroxy-6-metoxy-1,4-benzoquinol methylase
MFDVLAHVTEPEKILGMYLEHLSDEGHMLIASPNFNFLKYKCQIRSLVKDRSFEKTNIHLTTKNMIVRWLKQWKLKPIKSRYNFTDKCRNYSKLSLGLMDKYLSYEIVIKARKS